MPCNIQSLQIELMGVTMKGSTKMADYIDTEQELSEDETLKFEHLLAEVRSVDNKDRTKYLIDCCNNNLKELMQAISKYSESGKMTINLEFQVAKKSKELNIVATVEIKKPKGKITSNTFYRDEKGNIYLDDPELTKGNATVTKLN